MADWIGAAAAAQRLGIKQASLYSYVSRGVLTRRAGPDGRASLFDAGEVESLARRGRPRREPGAAELVIETALTEIDGDRLWYRGLDATALAASRTFEEVAGFLWTGSFTDAATAAPWHATGEAIAVGAAAQAALPAGTLPLERLQVIVPALAATDPLRLQLDPPAVIAAARGMIAGLVDCLPAAVPSGASYGAAPGPAAGAGPGPPRRAPPSRRGWRPGSAATRSSPASPSSCRPRWSCWPIMSSPLPPWPRGSPPRSGRIRTRSWPPGSGRSAAPCTAAPRCGPS